MKTSIVLLLKSVKTNLHHLTKRIDRKLNANTEFVIISNNCWGSYFYKRLDRPYNNPFVSLYIFGPDYIRLLGDFDNYMKLPLGFTDKSKYMTGPITFPIGMLGDIEMLFLHDTSEKEAAERWTRRTERMLAVTDKSNYYFKFCDRRIVDKDLINDFHKLPLANKISFGGRKEKAENHFVLTELEDGFDSVFDGWVLFNDTFKYLDAFKWIRTGKMESNLYSRLKSKFKFTY